MCYKEFSGDAKADCLVRCRRTYILNKCIIFSFKITITEMK